MQTAIKREIFFIYNPFEIFFIRKCVGLDERYSKVFPGNLEWMIN